MTILDLLASASSAKDDPSLASARSLRKTIVNKILQPEKMTAFEYQIAESLLANALSDSILKLKTKINLAGEAGFPIAYQKECANHLIQLGKNGKKIGHGYLVPAVSRLCG